MANYYSSDKSTQLLVALLKAHQIRNVIASPGTTNMALVASMQHDPFFTIYSSPDERSAAYMACGLASATGEPVVISCTEATASRNYFPALTEAYYRKLPILVITGHHGEEKIGHLISQTIDRSTYPKDTIKLSVSVNKICKSSDEWNNIIKINRAILELDHHGRGPVHINLETAHGNGFFQKALPKVRKIERYFYGKELPVIHSGRIAVFIGSHASFSKKETKLLDDFCLSNNAVVFGDNTCGYKGRFLVNSALIASQENYETVLLSMDLLIHVGEVSGDTYSTRRLRPKSVWRVSPDGELRDIFKKLTCVFEMEEEQFFSHYLKVEKTMCSYFDSCRKEYDKIYDKIPELPFSNIWVAKELHHRIPQDSVLHFGIFNSLRSWNFFHLNESIESICNVGGFGIDGSLSSIIGSSLATPEKLHFLVIGDLAFFYDINSLGNHHIRNNLRILLINNGRGVEFRHYDHPASKFGEEADRYIAAADHYGNKSVNLVRHYADDLGFEYMSASTKEGFMDNVDKFVSPMFFEKSTVFEVFTDTVDETTALKMIRNLVTDKKTFAINGMKQIAKEIVHNIKK